MATETQAQPPETNPAVAEKSSRIGSKDGDYTYSRWNTPLITAIVGAILALIANLVLAFFNQDLELRTEKEKTESTRILEMIKTGNLDNAARNLKFLIDTGLIGNPDRVDKIRKYLEENPNGVPVLPAIL